MTEQQEAALGMARARACAWSARTGRNVDDLMGVCHAAYMDAVGRWSPDGGSKLSSYVATLCDQALLRYCKKVDRPSEEEPVDLPDRGADVVALVCWREVMAHLPEEAAEMAHILLAAPGELLEELNGYIHGRRRLRWGVKRLLAKRHGWERRKIVTAMKQLDEALT